MSTKERFHWFDRVLSRHELQVGLRAKTAFRIGAGKSLDTVQTNLPLLRNRNGDPVVPGSSLKGVIRSGGESLLRGWAEDGGNSDRLACDLFWEPCLGLEDEQKKKLGDKSGKLAILAQRNHIKEHVCLACATFGAPGLSSHVRFSDAKLESGFTTVRDGVGLDRDLARAADQRKYDFEVVEPGAILTFTMHFENAQDWQVGLVLSVLNLLDAGFLRIGGFGSRGLGWFEVRDCEIRTWSLDQILSGADGQHCEHARFQQALREHPDRLATGGCHA